MNDHYTTIATVDPKACDWGTYELLLDAAVLAVDDLPCTLPEWVSNACCTVIMHAAHIDQDEWQRTPTRQGIWFDELLRAALTVSDHARSAVQG